MHREIPGQQRRNFNPSLGMDQVDTYPIWQILLKQERFGQRPKLLTCAADWTQPARRPVLRHFGLIPENLARKPYPETQERISIQNDWTETTVFEHLGIHQPVIFPNAASAVMTPFPEAVNHHHHEYCLIIGDDPQAWLYFWNRAFLLGDYRRTAWHSLCTPMDKIGAPPYLKAVRKFLQTQAFRSGNHPAFVDIVSFTANQQEIEAAGDSLVGSLDFLPRTAVMQPNEFPPITRDHDPYPEFRWPGIVFGPDRTTRQQASGTKSLLRIPNSEVSLERGAWVMELRVEHAPLHKFYSNEALWYKLPRHRKLAELFLTGRETRISADYSICAQMGQEGSFELNIPDDSGVLRAALGVRKQTHYTETLAVEYEQPTYKRIQPSDKGRYSSGVLSLLGGLGSAGSFFENSYWRNVAELLARRGSTNEDSVLQRIKNKISKNAATMAEQLGNHREEGINWLSRYVLHTAREQHMLDEDISFRRLDELLQEQRERFIASHPESQMDPPESATYNLLRRLQGLVEDRIFLQGVRLSCQNCGTTYWEEVGSVQRTNTCPGCGVQVPLRAEASWHYRLNSLIRNSVAFHGLIPVILTLHRLRSLARISFLYMPGLAFYGHDDDVRPAAEVDIVCVMDAQLVVGEVKTSTDEFTCAELKKLATLAQALRADVAVIGAYLDRNDQMRAKKAELENMLRGTSIITLDVVPHAYVFDYRPHA